MASFHEKVSICLENINEFADSIKKVHDVAECTLDHCEIGIVSNDLHSYVCSKKWSPHLLKKFSTSVRKIPSRIWRLFYGSEK